MTNHVDAIPMPAAEAAEPASPIELYPCRYGASPLVFRGPRVRLTRAYVAALGGTETHGRFIADPWPDLLEDRIDLRCVNLGIAQCGPDLYADDDTVLEICANARATVLQVPGAQNLSNRYYAVHPRRNDRLVSIEPALRAVFPEVEFAQYYFTRALLRTLHATSPERFAPIRVELRRIWVARMNRLLARIPGRTVLVWIGQRSPDAPAETVDAGDPPFVTRAMLAALRGRIAGLVEVVEAEVPAARHHLGGRIATPGDRPAARALPGPATHAEAARRLIAPVLRAIGDGPI